MHPARLHSHCAPRVATLSASATTGLVGLLVVAGLVLFGCEQSAGDEDPASSAGASVGVAGEGLGNKASELTTGEPVVTKSSDSRVPTQGKSRVAPSKAVSQLEALDHMTPEKLETKLHLLGWSPRRTRDRDTDDLRSVAIGISKSGRVGSVSFIVSKNKEASNYQAQAFEKMKAAVAHHDGKVLAVLLPENPGSASKVLDEILTVK